VAGFGWAAPTALAGFTAFTYITSLARCDDDKRDLHAIRIRLGGCALLFISIYRHFFFKNTYGHMLIKRKVYINK
jgi:hypothetical protein